MFRLSMDGFGPPVVRTGFGTERNGSDNGFGFGQNVTERFRFQRKNKRKQRVQKPFGTRSFQPLISDLWTLINQ